MSPKNNFLNANHFVWRDHYARATISVRSQRAYGAYLNQTLYADYGAVHCLRYTERPIYSFVFNKYSYYGDKYARILWRWRHKWIKFVLSSAYGSVETTAKIIYVHFQWGSRQLIQIHMSRLEALEICNCYVAPFSAQCVFAHNIDPRCHRFTPYF